MYHFYFGGINVYIKGYELNEETVSVIGKFAILWNWFENKHCENKCSPRKIKEVANTISINPISRDHFMNVLNNRRNCFGLREIEYVKNSLHPDNANKSKKESITIMCDFLENKGTELNCGCLLIIYRLRNNLMHGLKELGHLNGQIELFQAAIAVLESIGE